MWGHARCTDRAPRRGRTRTAAEPKKKRPHKAGAKSLRQVSYRQETYRAVRSLYASMRRGSKPKSLKRLEHRVTLAATTRAQTGTVAQMMPDFFRIVAGAVAPRPLLGLGGLAQAEPSHGIAMYGEPALPPDFVSLPYANPDAPKGGQIDTGRTRFLRLPQPFHHQGKCPLRPDPLRVREPDGPKLERTVLALRQHRRIDRDRRRPQLGRIHAASRGAILGRQPGDGRGRDLEFRDPRHQGLTRATRPPGGKSPRSRSPARARSGSPSTPKTASCR